MTNNIEQADLALVRVSAPYETLHPNYMFGSMQHEGSLDFAEGNADLEMINRAIAKVPTIVTVYLDRPAILSKFNTGVGSLLANFGASDRALFDVITGKAKPRGPSSFRIAIVHARGGGAIERIAPRHRTSLIQVRLWTELLDRMNKKVWGHRGCRGAGNPPENSLGAFQFALDAGAGGVELDVYLSADGVPVVLHDASLERMVGVSGEISFLTLPEIKKFRLLTLERRTSLETIPTLTEVLDLVDRYRRNSPLLVVNLELKDQCSCMAVGAILRQRIAAGWLVVELLGQFV